MRLGLLLEGDVTHPTCESGAGEAGGGRRGWGLRACASSLSRRGPLGCSSWRRSPRPGRSQPATPGLGPLQGTTVHIGVRSRALPCAWQATQPQMRKFTFLGFVGGSF